MAEILRAGLMCPKGHKMPTQRVQYTVVKHCVDEPSGEQEQRVEHASWANPPSVVPEEGDATRRPRAAPLGCIPSVAAAVRGAGTARGVFDVDSFSARIADRRLEACGLTGFAC